MKLYALILVLALPSCTATRDADGVWTFGTNARAAGEVARAIIASK